MNSGDDEKKKKLILIGVVAAIILVVVGLVVLFMKKGGGEGAGEQTKTDGVAFENSRFASEMMGGSLFGMVSGDIESVIMEPEEIAAGGDENSRLFNVTINNSEFKEDIYFPYSTYKFKMNLSDGREYKVNVAANLPNYYGVLVRRSAPTQNTPKLYMVFLKTEKQGGYERGAVMRSFEAWLKTVYTGNFNLTTKNLF